MNDAVATTKSSPVSRCRKYCRATMGIAGASSYRQMMKRTKNSSHLSMTIGLFMSAAVLCAGAAPCSAQTSTPADEPHTLNNARVFASDAGMVLNFIKPDKAADFEAVIAKLRDALQRSDKPERKQQAASWKVFRAKEPGANGSVLYVFTIDPAVKGADYTVSTILAEASPTEVQSLYKS